MKQLGVLLCHHHRLVSVAAILDVFETTNRFYREENGTDYFKINLFYTSPANAAPYLHYKPQPIQQAGQQHLLLLPAFGPDALDQTIRMNAELIPFIRKQYKGGSEIASFCTGAFLLARTGLLNDRAATTHINSAISFSRLFPNVHLKPEAVVTHQDSLYTSGGATSSFHLMIHLISRYCGQALGIRIAKYFAIDMDREQQKYFGTFIPVKNHSDELVAMTQDQIQSQFNQSVPLEHILGNIPASRRNLVRRFKAATGTTPINYLQETRINAAKSLLEQTRQTILEIMLHCGYNDLKAFRQVFRKITGLTPTAYREKFIARHPESRVESVNISS